MIETLNNLDTSIFLALNGFHSSFFDGFMQLFSDRYVWIPMYAMVVVILFAGQKWTRAALMLTALVVAILLTDQLCASVIRPLAERLRPSNPDNPLSELAYLVNGYRGGPYGFPSCHAANSFCLALFMSLTVKRKSFTMFIFGWALVNACSRLYLGVHYPGDLLVGAAIGAAIGAGCYWLARFVGKRYPNYFAAYDDDVEATEDAGVILTQLTPGAPLLTLSLADASVLSVQSGGASAVVRSYHLMMAAFAVTLFCIAIVSIP